MRRYHHFRINNHSHLHHDYHKLYRFLQLITIQILNPHISFIYPLISSSIFIKSISSKDTKHFVVIDTSIRIIKYPIIIKVYPSRSVVITTVREVVVSIGSRYRIITIPLTPSSISSRTNSSISSQ
jgi:hypothetical protein